MEQWTAQVPYSKVVLIWLGSPAFSGVRQQVDAGAVFIVSDPVAQVWLQRDV